MEVDSDYEFNAPKYIDFLSHDSDNENLDKWFDENPEGHEGGISLSEACFDDHHSNYQQATKAISAALQITKEEMEETISKTSQHGESKQEYCANPTTNQAVQKAEIAEEARPTFDSDVCHSGHKTEVINNEKDTDSNKMEESSDGPKQPSEDENIIKAEENPEPLETERTENAMESNMVKIECSKNPLPEDKNNVNQEKSNEENVTENEPKPKRITRSNSLREESKNRTILNSKKRKSATPLRQTPRMKTTNDSDNLSPKRRKVEVKRPLLTHANTPSFLRRIKNKLCSNKKTSEAIEIERIKQLQKETKKRLKENESFLQKALAPQPIHHQKPVVGSTKTMEFHFQTDQRIKQHPMKTRSDDEIDGNKFINQLRKHPPSPVFKNKKATKPVPFKFSSGSTSSSKQETTQATTTTSGSWKSVASAVIEFQTKTPDRWRSRPTNQQNNGPQIAEKTKMQLTHAKTPQLMTKRRSRHNHIAGQSDIEDKIVEEMKEYKFKAREFDHRIVEMRGEYGLYDVQRLPITKAKPFKFESDNRLELRKKNAPDKDEDVHEKNKSHKEKSFDTNDASVAHASRKRSLPRKTEPRPFSFETRDKAMFQRKQEKIQKIYQEEEKAREFHARPLPNLSPEPVIVKPNRHLEPEPFNLATDERGAARVQKWTSQIQKELEEEKEKTKFKAQPCKVVHQEAFVPKPSIKPLAEISTFKLNTEERSKKREDFEIAKKEQQRVKEDEMQKILKEKQEQEEKEVILMRKEMVHVANPVRNLGQIDIKPSDKPITLPETPKFETNKRFGSKISRL